MAWAAYAQSAKSAWQQKLGVDKSLHSSDFTPDQASLQDALVQYLLEVRALADSPERRVTSAKCPNRSDRLDFSMHMSPDADLSALHCHITTVSSVLRQQPQVWARNLRRATPAVHWRRCRSFAMHEVKTSQRRACPTLTKTRWTSQSCCRPCKQVSHRNVKSFVPLLHLVAAARFEMRISRLGWWHACASR